MLEIASGLAALTRAGSGLDAIAHGIRRMIPCDSVVLMRLAGDDLIPVASDGLVPEGHAQPYVVADHPRLAQFVRSFGPTRITDPNLPDPFDGLIGPEPLSRVHACVGCPLRIEGEVVGVLALDALDPRAFDEVGDDQLAAIAAFAAAAIRTKDLIERLEGEAARVERVARDLVRDCGRGDLVGQSAAINAIRHEIALAGRTDLAVLLTGETGAGKEVVARAIYDASTRRDQPLIYINCAALPESIAESELFGHVRGAFTGALDNRSGKFEVADGGTLFLDEIGELPLSIQPKLLRALQTGEIQRVGSDKLLKVDVRIIAATNRDLTAEVAAGRFRSDLFHRLSVYPIRVPPLRERRDDVPLLAGIFLNDARLRLGLGRIRLTGEARAALTAADWPGNVRELEHTILRAALRASEGRRRELVVIDTWHLGIGVPAVASPAPTQPPAAAPPSLHSAADSAKREQIVHALAAAHGNWAGAARILDVDRGNLHRLARRLGLIEKRTACASDDAA